MGHDSQLRADDASDVPVTLIIIIDLLAVAGLIASVIRKGLESTLPALTALLVLLPLEAHLEIPGLFALTSSRLMIAAFGVLYVTGARKRRKSPRK